MSENLKNPETSAQGAKKKVASKKEAVKIALDKLGMDAMPVEIQKYILDEFGEKMSTSHISNYKTDIQRQSAKSAAPKPSKPVPAPKKHSPKPVPAAPAPKALVAHAQRVTPKESEGIIVTLSDLEAVKGLADRLGVDGLKAIIDLLGK